MTEPARAAALSDAVLRTPHHGGQGAPTLPDLRDRHVLIFAPGPGVKTEGLSGHCRVTIVLPEAAEGAVTLNGEVPVLEV